MCEQPGSSSFPGCGDDTYCWKRNAQAAGAAMLRLPRGARDTRKLACGYPALPSGRRAVHAEAVLAQLFV